MLLNKAIRLFLDAVEARSGRPRTVGSYEQHLGSLQRFAEARELVDVEAVDPETLDAWVVSLRRQKTRWADHPSRPEEQGGLSDATLAGRIQTIKSFFKWCVERHYLDRSPAEHLVKPEVDLSADNKLINLVDLRKLEVAAEKLAQAGEPRDLAIVRFIAETGCRREEAASLRLSTLDLESFEAKVEGKTKKRMVEFTERTAVALKDWLQIRPDCGHDFVFVGRDKEQLQGEGIYQVFRRLAEASEVEGRFNPQAIRHRVGQLWTDEANLELARQKLGHKDIQTTARFYAHQDRSRVKQATERLSLLNLARKNG